jgi:hypothetical protein
MSNLPTTPWSGEPFIKGPFCRNFWSRVGRLGVNPLRFAMAVKYWSGFRRPRGMSQGVRIGLADMGALGLNSRSARLALRSLEGDGLAVVERPPGRKPVVTLVEHPIQHDRALFLPIPWGWWYAASPLPGRALPVALALWFRAGWLGGKAEFPFSLGDLEPLGLTRWTASRGLAALEAAGLAAVERRPGRSPIVTLAFTGVEHVLHSR